MELEEGEEEEFEGEDESDEVSELGDEEIGDVGERYRAKCGGIPAQVKR